MEKFRPWSDCAGDVESRFSKDELLANITLYWVTAPSTRHWAERSYNLQHWNVLPSGGHFAALEEPDLLVENIRNFFRTLRRGGTSRDC